MRTSPLRMRFSLPAVLSLAVLARGTRRTLVRLLRLGLGLLLRPGAHAGAGILLAVGAEPFAVGNRVERRAETLQMPGGIALADTHVRPMPAKEHVIVRAHLVAFKGRVILSVVLVAPNACDGWVDVLGVARHVRELLVGLCEEQCCVLSCGNTAKGGVSRENMADKTFELTR